MYAQKAHQLAVVPSILQSSVNRERDEFIKSDIFMATVEASLDLSESLQHIIQKYLGFSFFSSFQPIHCYQYSEGVPSSHCTSCKNTL